MPFVMITAKEHSEEGELAMWIEGNHTFNLTCPKNSIQVDGDIDVV